MITAPDHCFDSVGDLGAEMRHGGLIFGAIAGWIARDGLFLATHRVDALPGILLRGLDRFAIDVVVAKASAKIWRGGHGFSLELVVRNGGQLARA